MSLSEESEVRGTGSWQVASEYFWSPPMSSFGLNSGTGSGDNCNRHRGNCFRRDPSSFTSAFD